MKKTICLVGFAAAFPAMAGNDILLENTDIRDNAWRIPFDADSAKAEKRARPSHECGACD